jgi:phosphate/sulfate permease
MDFDYWDYYNNVEVPATSVLMEQGGSAESSPQLETFGIVIMWILLAVLGICVISVIILTIKSIIEDKRQRKKY